MVPGCQPDWISQSAFIFPGDFMPGGRQSSKAKARFIGNQSKRRCCHYSTAIMSSNEHLLHNDTLKLRTCLLPLSRLKCWAIPNKIKPHYVPHAHCVKAQKYKPKTINTFTYCGKHRHSAVCAHTHRHTLRLVWHPRDLKMSPKQHTGTDSGTEGEERINVTQHCCLHWSSARVCVCVCVSLMCACERVCVFVCVSEFTGVREEEETWRMY